MAAIWHHNKFFQYTTGIILVLLTVYLFEKIWFIFDPILEFLVTLFIPVILAGIFYYVLRPVVGFIVNKTNMPRTLAILLIYIVLLLVFAFISFLLGPILIEQFNTFKNESVDKIKKAVVDINNLYGLQTYTTNYLYKIN